jgi:hypothetical protein
MSNQSYRFSECQGLSFAICEKRRLAPRAQGVETLFRLTSCSRCRRRLNTDPLSTFES